MATDIFKAIFIIIIALWMPITLIISAVVLAFLFKSGRLSTGRIAAWIHRRPIECTPEQFKLITKAIRAGDTSILYRIRENKPKKEIVPTRDDIAILSIEKNGGEIRFDLWNCVAPNVVTNNDRGRTADLGQAKPVTLVIQGKPHIGFIVEGDRGIGLKLEDQVLKLTTTAQQAWAFLQSAKLSAFLTTDLTGRQILLYLVIGVIIGQLLFFFLKI